MLFLAFAVALRQGRFHNGNRVRRAEVERALRECAQLMVAEGLDDPRKSDTSDHRLARSITSYVKSCKDDDPPSLPQQAIPSSTIRWIATHMGSSQQHQTHLTAHLMVLAFFFLLRVGEYTKSSDKRRTIPLRKKDIRLWRAGVILPNDGPLEVLLTADAVTICLENQKNGHKNAVLHHTSSHDATIDPVRSVAILLNAIRSLPNNTPIGTIVDAHNRILQITSDEIRRSKSQQHRTTCQRMDTHSLASDHTAFAPVGPCTSNWLDTTTTLSKNLVVGPAIHISNTFKPKLGD
jgi:hypothetical protein